MLRKRNLVFQCSLYVGAMRVYGYVLGCIAYAEHDHVVGIVAGQQTSEGPQHAAVGFVWDSLWW